MQSRRHVPVSLLALMLIIIIPATLTAGVAPQRSEVFAIPSSSIAGIQWQPITDHERIVLTVTLPDGTSFSRVFPQGKTPTLQLRDLPAHSVVDGSYTWELRATPNVPTDVASKLQAARAADDDVAIARIQHEAGLDVPLVQSGSFQVAGGGMIASNLMESITRSATSSAPKTSTMATGPNSNPPLKPAVNDDVIADDLIVQGSACIGLDCVNGESFGFDTIRLKENNTRIKFDDTSASTGFANHDWQLTANDSASGGLNKFSVEDITAATVPTTIEGSAPTNSLYINSSGKVGFHTSTPALDLHIKTGNTPAMRYEQDGTGGFTAQTWDIGANEANFFVRDVTSGSRLPFRIRPGAPTSSIDIAASGRVGVNNAGPNYQVDVRTITGGDGISIGGGGTPTGAMDPGIILTTNTSNAATRNWGIFCNRYNWGDFVINTSTTNSGTDNPYNDTFRFVIDPAGNIGVGVKFPSQPIQHSNGAYLSTGGVWTNASSRDLKQDIEQLPATKAMDALAQLEPVTYAYKADPNEHHVGFIAEDVPALVATQDRKSLSPMDVVAVLTKVVQEQQKTIDELKTRLDQLEKQQ